MPAQRQRSRSPTQDLQDLKISFFVLLSLLCAIKRLSALTCSRLAARQVFFFVSKILFNWTYALFIFKATFSEWIIWPVIMPCGGSLFISYWNNLLEGEKSCPCEKSDFLAMHQSAEEECRGTGVEREKCMSRIFFCYRPSKKTNSSYSNGWQLIAASKPLYNCYLHYLIFCWHMCRAWFLTWRLQPMLSVLSNKLILLHSVYAGFPFATSKFHI